MRSVVRPLRVVGAIQRGREVRTRQGVSCSFDSQLEHIQRLSCYLALKATEAQAKVHRSTWDKTLATLGAYNHSHDVLLRRASLSMTDEATVMNNLGIRDNIRRHGNPLSNGHRITRGVVNDHVVLIVESPGAAECGRHSLKPACASVGCDDDDATQRVFHWLAAMSVDNLEDIKLVRSIVLEFLSRDRLKKDVSVFAPQGPACHRSSVDGREGEGSCTGGGLSQLRLWSRR